MLLAGSQGDEIMPRSLSRCLPMLPTYRSPSLSGRTQPIPGIFSAFHHLPKVASSSKFVISLNGARAWNRHRALRLPFKKIDHAVLARETWNLTRSILYVHEKKEGKRTVVRSSGSFFGRCVRNHTHVCEPLIGLTDRREILPRKQRSRSRPLFCEFSRTEELKVSEGEGKWEAWAKLCLVSVVRKARRALFRGMTAVRLSWSWCGIRGLRNVFFSFPFFFPSIFQCELVSRHSRMWRIYCS